MLRSAIFMGGGATGGRFMGGSATGGCGVHMSRKREDKWFLRSYYLWCCRVLCKSVSKRGKVRLATTVRVTGDTPHLEFRRAGIGNEFEETPSCWT